MKYIVLLVIKMGDYKIRASIWIPAASEEEAIDKFVGKFKNNELLIKIEEIKEI